MIILAINPGSTSTKISVFNNENELFTKVIQHSKEEFALFKTVYDQKDIRKNYIIEALQEENINIKDVDAVVGRGGLLKPIESGTYEVTNKMLQDIKAVVGGIEHASNLGAVIANEIANEIGVKSYIVDPVVVDEMDDIARFSGMKGIDRKSIFHALNQKAVAKEYAKNINKKYNELNLIVAHMGGGSSVGLHVKGRVVDVNDALNGDGPMSTERAGGLPSMALLKLCKSGKYTKSEIKKQCVGYGGLVSYCGTNNAKEVSEKAKAGDKNSQLVLDALTYQVAKEIGSLATAINGNVDAIILTGGVAYSKDMMNDIKERVSFISEIVIFPGEKEMDSLVKGVLRVYSKEEEVKIYE